jgi:hypothetical protein
LNHTPLPHVNSLSSKLIDGKRWMGQALVLRSFLCTRMS